MKVGLGLEAGLFSKLCGFESHESITVLKSYEWVFKKYDGIRNKKPLSSLSAQYQIPSPEVISAPVSPCDFPPKYPRLHTGYTFRCAPIFFT